MLAQICVIDLSFEISSASYCQTATHHTATRSSILSSQVTETTWPLRHKALIFGLGGNDKTTVTNKMSYIY